jgi:hypothetical protein
MPIERDLSTLLKMADDDFIRWREKAREFLSEHADEELSALYAASGTEICVRAEAAWSAASEHGPAGPNG